MCEKCGFSGCKHDTDRWQEDADAFAVTTALMYFDKEYGPEPTDAEQKQVWLHSRKMYASGALFWRRYMKNPIKVME